MGEAKASHPRRPERVAGAQRVACSLFGGNQGEGPSEAVPSHIQGISWIGEAVQIAFDLCFDAVETYVWR